ncbi:MAG: S-layer homology domain-containing protein [Actinomycetia bacterium]|nr:S-layer homology domain-containing protein [Actinomycetes bacterium]
MKPRFPIIGMVIFSVLAIGTSLSFCGCSAVVSHLRSSTTHTTSIETAAPPPSAEGRVATAAAILPGGLALAGDQTPALDGQTLGADAWTVDGWTAVNLASGPGRQEVMGIDGDYCVYREVAGEGPAQLYLANLATGQVTRVSDARHDCPAAAIDGGYVVYQAYAGPDNPEIFLYDIATGQTTRLTANSYPDQAPQIGDGGVTWVASIGPAHDGSDQEIFFYDIAVKTTTQVTDDRTVDGDPEVSGSRVAWWALVGEERQVFVYDHVSGTTTRVSQDSTSNRDVSISGNLVAWIGNPPELFEFGQFIPKVYLYDLSSGRVETLPADIPAEVVQMFIDTIVLDDGLLAWTWQEAAADHVTVYDPATGKTTDFGGEMLSPIKTLALSADLVVWQESDWHDDEIMAGDLNTGITSRLTVNGTNDRNPMTANGWVVWQDCSQGRGRLMVAATDREPSVPFVDVGGTMRSRSAAVALAEEGIVCGYPTAGGAEFRPDSPLLRAQLAKMLVMAFAIPVSEDMTCPFRDLGPDDPSTLYPNDYVAAAYQAGLIRGTTAETFSPWQTVTRGQAVSVVVRYVLKQYPDSLPRPPAGEFALCDEYPSVHNDNIRVAFYNGLLGGVLTGDSGWNPWWEIKRAEVAQILVNARQHTVPAPRPARNFFAEWLVLKSLDELSPYLAQQKALLAQLAAKEPDEEALVRISFIRPVSVAELARLEAAYGLEPVSRDAIFERAGIGGGMMWLSAGDWVRSMQAESFMPINLPPGPPGIVVDETPGGLEGFTGLHAWAPLEALARLQREEAVLLVDPWRFFEQMRDARRAGIDVTAGSYPSVYPEYQKWAAGR